MASVVGGIGEGHRTVVVDSWFCCEQGDVVDTGNCLVDVAPALASEVEGSGLGGFEGVAWPLALDRFQNRLDLDEYRRRCVDSNCAYG